MACDAIVLLTHRRDVFVIDRVEEALRRRGVRPVRFDTDRYPREHTLTVLHRGDGPRYILDTGTGAVAGEEVAAVWTRSIWPPEPGEELAPEHRDACRKQAHAAFIGFLDGLGAARWVSDLDNIWRAENKLRQLRVASEVGLPCPRTLVTSDPERVRRFYREVGGRMVTKLLVSLTRSMTRTPGTFHTSDVTEADLEGLEELRFGPMIFQEKLEKERELRVMYVAGRLFPGAIRAHATTRGTTDWRLARVEEVAWEPAEVPAPVAAKLRLFMAKLGLEAGAFDLVVTPSREHVFLEVNPLGEWGMLERDLGLPISEAVAAALVGPQAAGEDRAVEGGGGEPRSVCS